MKVSMGAVSILNLYGVEGGLKMLADAGFEAVDFPLHGGKHTPWAEGFFKDPFCTEFEEHFRHIGDMIKAVGMDILQSHAPYTSPDCSDPEMYAVVQRDTVCAIYAAAYMGCKNIVVHPVLHPDFNCGENRDRALKVNFDYFAAFAPVLQKTGVTMCIENVFWGERGKPKIANACSDADQLGTVIDMLNEAYGPHFAACLDVGHAVVSSQDPTQMLKALGDRVKVLHLHDNAGVKDDHLIPARGVIRWNELLPALKEVGFGGNFNMEVYFRDFEKEPYNKNVHQAACNFIYAVGRSMADIAEGIR